MGKSNSAQKRLVKAREILDAWAEGVSGATDDREISFCSALALAELWALLHPAQGRPADPTTRPRRVQLALFAEWIYGGRLLLDLVPQTLRLHDWQDGSKADAERAVLQCKGKRDDSDKAAGRILNASPETVRKARTETFKQWKGWGILAAIESMVAAPETGR